MRSNPNPLVVDFNDYTPIVDLDVVTPNDSADLTRGPCRGVIFSSTAAQPSASGNIVFITAGGQTVTLYVSSNWFGIQYLRVKRVLATGTTFNGQILACY